MPKFIDHHPRMDMSKMPLEAIQKGQQMLQQMKKDIQSKRADRFGVTTFNVFMGVNGESWCFTEAPSSEAVIKSHEANGARLSPNDVVEVTPLV